jgi:aryl-alcohol dehydrogenase-like predicted oxidoreductase
MELRGTDHFPRLAPAAASAILNAVLDSGINYIDTSPDYGYSEELIGRHLAHRRDEFFIASKCGCPVEPPDLPHSQRQPHSFTRENIRAGVEQSLRRLQTDYLDVVQFHLSPARAVLEANDSIAELESLQREGKVRFIGVSGTEPELAGQIAMGVFDVFQIPYSLIERQHEALIAEAARAGGGIVIRGGVSRGIIVKDESVIDGYPDFLQAGFRARRRRWLQTEVDDLLDGMDPMEFLLRFTLSHQASMRPRATPRRGSRDGTVSDDPRHIQPMRCSMKRRPCLEGRAHGPDRCGSAALARTRETRG